MKTKGLTLLLFLALSCQNRPQQGIVVKDLLSPDGKMKMEFLLTADGTPQYSLSYEGSQVVLPSDLGFELRGTVKASKLVFGDRMEKVDEQEPYSLHDDFEVIGSSTDTFDETWAPVWGEESVIRNYYNELLVNLKQKGTGNKMDIRFRLYDDGLGFRYEFPGMQPLNYFVIKEELTNFVMADDCTAWWIPGDFDTQEYEYTESRLSEISQHLEAAVCGNSSQTLFSMSGVQTSLLMRTDEGLFVSIHEAALVDYPCMHLNVDEKTHTLTSFLTPDAQGWKGYMQTPCHTPWRTVQVTDSATKMLASRLILNLNDPCIYDDTSWIHPVKYMGVWWEMISNAGSWSLRAHLQSSVFDLAKDLV